MSATFRLNYYPWITQHVDPASIRQAIQDLANEFQAALEKDLPDASVELLDPVDVPEQIDLVSSADRQIGLMNPIGFTFAAAVNRGVEATAVALRITNGKVGPTY
jgi:hypothetical protein